MVDEANDQSLDCVWVLWEQTNREDAVMLGAFTSFSAAATASDRVLDSNGLRLDLDRSSIGDHWDSRWCVDARTGDVVTQHLIRRLVLDVVDDSVRWFDGA